MEFHFIREFSDFSSLDIKALRASWSLCLVPTIILLSEEKTISA